MKITVDRKSFLDACQDIIGVVPSKSNKPILRNMKLVVDEGDSQIMATDEEVSISRYVHGVEIDQPGGVLLPADRLMKILKAGDDPTITIQSDGDSLAIGDTTCDYKIPTEDADLYPNVPEFNKLNYWIVAARDIKRSIKRTIFATELNSTRYALGGVYFGIKDDLEDLLDLVALDGRRMANSTIGYEQEGTPDKYEGNLVVPTRTLKMLGGMLDDGDPPVHIATVSNPKLSAILFRTGNSVIHSRLVEGRFPRFEDVLPKFHNAVATIEAGLLLATIEKVSVTTGEESRGIHFEFEEGRLTVRSESADLGKSRATAPIEYEGGPVSLEMDSAYLIDMLRAVGKEEKFAIKMIDDRESVMFHLEGYQYMMQPLSSKAAAEFKAKQEAEKLASTKK